MLLTNIFVIFDSSIKHNTHQALYPMTIEEVTNEPMYCLFAPDGTWQPMSLAADFPTCVAQIKLLHQSKLGQSFHQLVNVKGFKILPVSVTAVVTGDENTAFQR